jgi:sugar phosphate isomerase/epimerase
LENHDRFTPTDYAYMVKQIGSNLVGICLDTANSIAAGEGLASIIDILSPFTVNLHLKDFGFSRLSHKQGFIVDGRIAGEGLLNIPSLIKKILQYNRCRTCLLEQWVPLEKKMKVTLEKENQWAEKSMTYLKGLALWS